MTIEHDLWAPRPLETPRADFPGRVRIFEVGPRDGLQAEAEILPTAVKRELCQRLWRSGVTILEITSFVPPRWIPQLADAEELAAGLTVPEGTRGVALVPNLKGLDRARGAGFSEVSVVASTTESFSRANLNAGLEAAMDRAEQIAEAADQYGMPVRGYLSMAFGDPWEGHTAPHRVGELAARLYRAGCRTVAVSDTIGTATPGHVKEVIAAVTEAGVPREAVALHLHDTFGLALTNVYAALENGVTEFDTSVGGLGRCPFAPGAAGNLATEDLVWMLDGLGIETGLDLDGLVETSRWMARQLGRSSPSRVVRALTARAAE